MHSCPHPSTTAHNLEPQCRPPIDSFPEAPEVMLDDSGKCHIIRRRQLLPEIWQNEVPFIPS